MARRKRNWEIDWAGPHGTAWGTVNACWSTITIAWVGHLAELYGHAPSWLVAATAFVGGLVAVIIALLRASVGRPQPRATTIYQVLCIAGADLWIVHATGQQSWPWPRWWLIQVGILAAMAIVAGFLAALASPEKPDAAGQARPTEKRNHPTANKYKLAAEWEERLNRLCDGDLWTVPNIEMWPRGNGYTVEAIAPPGGLTWKAVDNARTSIEGDLDLIYAGAVNVSQGVTRRAALIEVTTKDILADDYPYPDDRPVHSIREDLRVGLRDDGNPIGPNLLQNCMVLAGEAGSGKTNAGHDLTAEIVTTDDALLWDWELTGGGLWAAWMEPWLRGEVRTPPIDWCAWDGRELLWMTRAALRIGYTRKPGYRTAMIEADDDKVPVSPTLPEIILMGDEIAKVTGAMSEHPQAQENLRLIAFELRAAAIRAIFLALRGTDDVISSSIQSQCQVTGVMKIGSKAEAGWVFGGHYQFGPEDTPYPGCGGLSLASGQPPVRMKYHRMKPSQIRKIVLLAEPRRPKLDELSRLAANGRHPDGTPMPDLLPGELDCYDTRWQRYRAQFGQGVAAGGGVASAPAQQVGTVAILPEQGQALSPADAKKNLEQAMANLDRAVQDAASRRPDDDGVPLSADELAAFEALTQQMEAEGFGEDWGEEDPDRAESAPQPDDEEVLLQLLDAAGPGGVGPKDLLAQLAGKGIVIHRDTLHARLKALRGEGKVHQPRFGKWARGSKS